MTSARRSLVLLLFLVLGAAVAHAGPVEEECQRLRAAGIELLRRAEDLMRVRADGAPDVGEARRLQAAAVAKFDQAVRLCPDDPENLFWLGTAHIVRGDTDGYARAMQALRSIAPQDIRVEYLRAHFHLQLGRRPDLAAAGFERVRARVPAFRREQLSILLWRAYMDYGEAKTNEAIASLSQSQTGIYKEAITQYEKAVREGEPSPVRVYMARRNLAEVLRRASEYARAQAQYELLVRGWRDDPVIHYGLATVLADQLKYPEAVTHWEEALRLRSRVRLNEPTLMADLLLRYGNTLVFAGRAAEGGAQLEAYAAGSPPDDSRGWYYLGTFERDHPFEVALTGLAGPAGPGAPSDAAARKAAVAKALAPFLGKTEAEATALLQTLPAVLVRKVAIEEADRIKDALEPLGAVVEETPNFDPAIEHLEKAHAIDPLCEEAARALLSIYTVMKPNPERAKELQAWLDDDAARNERRAARKRRVLDRADRTEGCQ